MHSYRKPACFFNEEEVGRIQKSEHQKINVKVSKGSIDDVSYSGSALAKVKYTSQSVTIFPKKCGTATITLTDAYGTETSIKVTVTKTYYNKLLKKKSKINSLKYGQTEVAGKTIPSAAISFKINGKKYSKTADKKGKFKIKIPVIRIGSQINATFSYGGASYKKTVKVNGPGSSINLTKNVYRNSTRVTGNAHKVHAGDYIQVKINGRTYKQKISKDAGSFHYNIAIHKSPYGKTVNIKLFNKFGQTLASCKNYVYYGNQVYVGMSKSIVKWVYGWNKPDHINDYMYFEQWCYDDDGDGWAIDSYLYFNPNGKVTSWQILN